MIRLMSPLLVAVLALAIFGSASAAPTKEDESKYWLERRAEFFKNTTFPLSEDNRRLIGGKFCSIHDAHLPFWFDYELFKRVFNKSTSASVEEETRRHNVYINTCLRTIKSRTLFRMLSGTSDTVITRDADLFYAERSNGQQGNKINNNGGGNNVVVSLAFGINPERHGNEVADNDAAESPIERAIRLMRAELDQVESRNQIETYLRAFNVSTKALELLLF